MALKLGVVIYSGAGRADEVLTGFQELHPIDREWTDYVGLIERHKTGRISIYGALGSDESWNEEGAKPLVGLSAGGVTGMLLGALAGPAGVAAFGTLGLALGGLFGAADEEDTDQPTFDIIRSKLGKDSSALVLLADEGFVDRLLATTGKDAREVYQQKVREELRGRLDEALREAAAHPVPQASQKPGPQPGAH
ncbi:MAG TPA: DUF1269 domain-containing protein [Anaeromyxobacter sp.]